MIRKVIITIFYKWLYYCKIKDIAYNTYIKFSVVGGKLSKVTTYLFFPPFVTFCVCREKRKGVLFWKVVDDGILTIYGTFYCAKLIGILYLFVLNKQSTSF